MNRHEYVAVPIHALEGTRAATGQDMAKARLIFEAAGLPVHA
ncbi:MAG: hypothetical protein ACO398_11180 [Kiritimatiellia bacterium]